MYIISIIVVIVLIAVDQITKYIALVQLKPIERMSVINGVFDLTFVQNEGAAFGIFQGARWFFVAMTVVVLCGIVYSYVKMPKGKVYTWMRVALVMIFSGAVGNFIDRFANGSVIDFLYFSLIDFPVFNIADTYVVCGGILLGILVLFFVKEPKMKDMQSEEAIPEEAGTEDKEGEDARIG